MAMKKVQSGDPLVIPAGTFNTFVDAARDFQQRQRSQQQRPCSSFTDRSTVLLRNDSGAGRSRFSVLEVDGVVIGPGDNLESFQNTPAVTGVTPTEDHAGRFAILLDPIEAGEIGRALLAGVCPCQVDVTDEEHRYAAPTDGDASKLTSAESGPAHLLWADTGTGTKWCLVRLGGPAPTAGGDAAIKIVSKYYRIAPNYCDTIIVDNSVDWRTQSIQWYIRHATSKANLETDVGQTCAGGSAVGQATPAIGGQFTLVNGLETEAGGGNDVDVFIMNADWGSFSAGDLVLDANSNGDESFVHVLVVSYATTDANAVFENLTP
jgi:hypothetical protein